MDPNPKKLQHRTIEEARHEHDHHSEEKHTVREFAEVEDLLRHDAAQTPLPPQLEERLKGSIAATGVRPLPWWRRLFRV